MSSLDTAETADDILKHFNEVHQEYEEDTHTQQQPSKEPSSSSQLSHEVDGHQNGSETNLLHLIDSLSFSQYLDSVDPLRSHRDAFNLPLADHCTDNSLPSVYLCGNSLGLQPKLAVELVTQEMTKWGKLGVEGHFRGEIPWVSVDEPCLPLLQEMVGAKYVEEVAVMNSLTVNLHLLLLSFYQPKGTRCKILMEEAAFCSDHHVVRSQLALHQQKIEEALVLLSPRKGETYLRTVDIVDTIHVHGDSLALVLLPGVQFYTGQFFDIAAITEAAHTVGAYAGWDLAHAVGNLPLQLHKWNVDFAAWCTYKYLNSGPGAIAGIFFHHQHHDTPLPRLSGWWGQTASTRFQMKPEHVPHPGAQSYPLSNPAVLPTVCLYASLQVFHNAGGMTALRRKSVQLTAYLELLLKPILAEYNVILLTPPRLCDRGCQLSLLLPVPIRPLLHRLECVGMVCDGREPNVIRVSPTPLYNRFEDVYRFVQAFKQVLKEEIPTTNQTETGKSL